MIGLANADGGRIVVGISNRQVEGTNSSQGHINELMQAGRNHAMPPVRNAVHFVDCVNQQGVADQVMVIDVEASETIHRTPGNRCFLRVGDETRELGPTEERELAFDKGEASFDRSIVPLLTKEDLALKKIESYAHSVGAHDLDALMRSRGIYLDRGSRVGVTQTGYLVFGLNTPVWSFIRYLKYDGTSAETGPRSNLVEDIRLEGTIPELIEQAQALLRTEIGTVIRLMENGRFGRVPALPEFAWLEAIVNAVTHRSYSLQGDGIHVRQFSDRLEVQSPGRLPGLVRVQNIQNARFSRNPHIARVLAEMTNFVRELNEGVRRMFQEMKQSGLREPEFRVTDTSVCVILYKQPDQVKTQAAPDLSERMEALRQKIGRKGAKSLMLLLKTLSERDGQSTSQVANAIGVSPPTAKRYLDVLAAVGLMRYEAKSPNDPKGQWRMIKSAFWEYFGSS